MSPSEIAKWWQTYWKRWKYVDTSLLVVALVVFLLSMIDTSYADFRKAVFPHIFAEVVKIGIGIKLIDIVLAKHTKHDDFRKRVLTTIESYLTTMNDILRTKNKDLILDLTRRLILADRLLKNKEEVRALSKDELRDFNQWLRAADQLKNQIKSVLPGIDSLSNAFGLLQALMISNALLDKAILFCLALQHVIRRSGLRN